MEPTRVLIVDDTIVYRSILRGVVESLPDCVVSATASDGAMALERLAAAPADVVLLDVEMPVMGGLETLAEIRHRHPMTAVIMVSGVNSNAAQITIRALQQGALDFVPKPESNDPAVSRQMLTEQLRGHIEAFRLRRNPGTPPAAPAAPLPPPASSRPQRVQRPARIEAIGIGVSTGGPSALARVVPRLPASLPIPVLIVQHMPPVFTQSLAASLNQQSGLTVKEGEDGEPIRAGAVYIAPGGRHMTVRRSAEGQLQAGINDNPPENNCRPAVDVLFRSMAAQFGGNVLSVILTGMGSDGREGVRALRRHGAVSLAQDQASSVVYGMPRAVAEAGLVDEVLPLEEIAARIIQIVENPLSSGART